MYTCPAGRTAILKDIRLSSRVSTDEVCVLSAISGPEAVNFFNGTLPGNGKTLSVQGFVVLEPGDKLSVFSNVAAALNYWVSGSELEGVAPAAAVVLPA